MVSMVVFLGFVCLNGVCFFSIGFVFLMFLWCSGDFCVVCLTHLSRAFRVGDFMWLGAEF